MQRYKTIDIYKTKVDINNVKHQIEMSVHEKRDAPEARPNLLKKLESY